MKRIISLAILAGVLAGHAAVAFAYTACHATSSGTVIGINTTTGQVIGEVPANQVGRLGCDTYIGIAPPQQQQ